MKRIIFLNEKKNTDFDSPYCESLLFTLSVCKTYAIRNGAVVPDAPSDQNTVAYPYVNVQRFLWYEPELSVPLLSLSTRGVPTDVVKFEPG